jgi:hypothetical protein
MHLKFQTWIFVGGCPRHLGVSIMLVHDLDDLSGVAVNPQKERFTIHHAGDDLAQSLGWSDRNDVTTDWGQVRPSRRNRAEAIERNQPASYMSRSHCFFSTLTG